MGPGGKSAITHYKVEAESKTHSLVSLQLETGRTHQIRVHFAYIGHPLVGDGLYGDHDEALAHQALHCDRVALTHPFTDEVLYVEKACRRNGVHSLRACIPFIEDVPLYGRN